MHAKTQLSRNNVSRALSGNPTYKTIMRTLHAVALLLIGWNNQSFGATLKEGDLAPNWMLSNANNQATTLYNSTSQGRRCVLIFWTARCQRCKTLLPQINELSKETDASNTVFYGLNIWEGKDPISYFAEQAPDVNLLLNADAVASRYGITTTPSIVVVENDRRISYLNFSFDRHVSIQELKDSLTQSIPANTQDPQKGNTEDTHK